MSSVAHHKPWKPSLPQDFEESKVTMGWRHQESPQVPVLLQQRVLEARYHLDKGNGNMKNILEPYKLQELEIQ